MKRKITAIILIVALALSLGLVPAMPAMAVTDYYVTTTGSDGNVGSQANPWLTIQHAIDVAVDGDIIIVDDGTYTEDLTVDEDLTLKSVSGRDVTTIEGSGSGWVITLNSGATGFTLGGANGDGFTVIGGTSSKVLLGTVNGPSGVTLSYNTFDTTGEANMAIAVGAGGIDGLNISHNILALYRDTSGGNTGIYFDTGTISNLVVDDNTVYSGSSTRAVWLYFVVPSGKPGNAVNGAVISNNDVTFAVLTVQMAGRSAVVDGFTVIGNTFERANIFIGPGAATGEVITNMSITGNTVNADTYYEDDPFFEILGPTAGNIDWATLTVNCNTFNLLETQWAVKNNVAGTTLDATMNWWGSVSGPTHSTNPGGTGALVSDNVDYEPWSYTPDRPCKWNMLGVATSGDGYISKTVKYIDEDGDGLIEVGEVVDFLVVIQVHNDSGEAWTDVTVKDRFGAELGVDVANHDANNPTEGTATLTTKGNSDKVFLEWAVGPLAAGATATLVLDVETDVDPGGDQEYTETGPHDFNSGATLKYRIPSPSGKGTKQQSATTGSVSLEVVWDLVGDWELEFDYLGTIYPHDMNIDTENPDGSFSGTGTNSDTWTVTGTVSGDAVSMTIDYDSSSYEVTATGFITAGGDSMNGTWSNPTQSGTWSGTRVP